MTNRSNHDEREILYYCTIRSGLLEGEGGQRSKVPEGVIRIRLHLDAGFMIVGKKYGDSWSNFEYKSDLYFEVPGVLRET